MSETTIQHLSLSDLEQIYLQLKDLPDILHTRETCRAFSHGPAADHVHTLCAKDDYVLPDKAWRRFPSADGIVVILPSILDLPSLDQCQLALTTMHQRVRRIGLQCQHDFSRTPSSASAREACAGIVDALLSRPSCSLLQQLRLDVPVDLDTAETMVQLMPALRKLSLLALYKVHAGIPSTAKAWKPAALPGGLEQLTLCSQELDSGVCIDVAALISAKNLQQLQLCGTLETVNETAVAQMTGLRALTIGALGWDAVHGKQHSVTLLQPLQHLQQLSMLYASAHPSDWPALARLTALQSLRLATVSLTDACTAAAQLTALCVDRLWLDHGNAPASAALGRVTRAAPHLRSLHVTCEGAHLAQLAAAVAGHTALTQLLLPASFVTIARPAWPGQVLAGIASLSELVLSDVTAQDLASGLLQDLLACTQLQQLRLRLEGTGVGPESMWHRLSRPAQQQLRQLAGRPGAVVVGIEDG